MFSKKENKKKTPRKASFNFFSPEKLGRLFTLKEVKPSPDSKIFTFDNLFPPLRHSRRKPVEGWRRLSRFPAKMTLVHAWVILSIEKISYLSLSSSQNLTNSPLSRKYSPMRIHVLPTACDVISFSGQGPLCPLTCTEWRDLSNHYQNEHNSVKDTGEKGQKPCNIDLKISMKILFHCPPTFPFT